MPVSNLNPDRNPDRNRARVQILIPILIPIVIVLVSNLNPDSNRPLFVISDIPLKKPVSITTTTFLELDLSIYLNTRSFT